MANGLFATKPMNTAGEIQRLMQLEQEKRIRDAGAGFSNPLVRARAMAGQGMQEAISGMGTGLTGLLGGEGKVRMDPRMQEALKRDKDRKDLLAMYNNADTDGDGKVSLQEYRTLAKEFRARGYQSEAQEVLKEAEREYGTGFQRMQMETKKTEQDRKYGLDERMVKTAENRLEEAKRKNADQKTIAGLQQDLRERKFTFEKTATKRRLDLNEKKNELTQKLNEAAINKNKKLQEKYTKDIEKINRDLKALPAFDALDKDETEVMISILDNADFVKLLPDSVKRFLRGVDQRVKVRIGQKAKDILNEARRGGTAMNLEEAIKQAIKNFASGNTNPSDTQGGSRATPPATRTQSDAANYVSEN